MRKKFLILASVLLLCFSVFLFGFASPKSVSATQETEQWEIVEIDGKEYYKKPVPVDGYLGKIYFDISNPEAFGEAFYKFMGSRAQYIFNYYFTDSINSSSLFVMQNSSNTGTTVSYEWTIGKNQSTSGIILRFNYDVTNKTITFVRNNLTDNYYTLDANLDYVSTVGLRNSEIVDFIYVLEEIPKLPYIDSPSLTIGGIVSVFAEFIPALASGIVLTFSNLFIDGQNLTVLGSVFMTFVGLGLCVSVFRVVYKIFRNRIKTKV